MGESRVAGAEDLVATKGNAELRLQRLAHVDLCQDPEALGGECRWNACEHGVEVTVESLLESRALGDGHSLRSSSRRQRCTPRDVDDGTSCATRRRMTMGDLNAKLFSTYEERHQDAELTRQANSGFQWR